MWCIDWRCRWCHATDHRFGIPDVEMVRLGFDIRKLENVVSRSAGGVSGNEEVLKLMRKQ